MSWGGKGGRGTTVGQTYRSNSADCVPAWGYFRSAASAWRDFDEASPDCSVARELQERWERWRCEYCRLRNSERRDVCRSCGAPAP